MKKFLILFLVALVSVSLFAGGSKENTAATSAGVTGGPQIKLYVLRQQILRLHSIR